MAITILPTIENTENGLAVSSETIAAGAGVQHKNVLELLATYEQEFKEFGPSAFETRSGAKRPQGGTGRPVRVALLNEPQATLLLTFMRNTTQVIAFKIALVKAFYRMKHQLENPAHSDTELGLTIGQPLPALPPVLQLPRVDPRTTRNDRIAEAARENTGQWVPITINEFTPNQYAELAKAIRYGARKSFKPAGAYQSAHIDGQLYIRHETGEQHD